MGKKLVIITMTRWHSDDVIGRLTDPENPCYNAIEAEKWKIIRLPAIAEDDDVLGRKEGEPLWPDGPDTFNLDFLQSQQRLDPLGFSALYQQRPTVADGTMFRRETIQYYDELPEELQYYASSDHAVGTNQRNDPSCLLKVGVDKQDNIYITDVIWRRMAADVAVESMLTMGGGKRRPIIWWAERGHISKSIGPFLRKRMLETGTYINLVEVTPANDKATRAQSIAARVAMGKVYFPRNAPWVEKAINELMAFPNGTHDDFVDALAYIGLGLRSQHAPRGAVKPNTGPKIGSFAWLKANDKSIAEKKRAAALGGF
jgi:predicted phage terminase large subunit-like protein